MNRWELMKQRYGEDYFRRIALERKNPHQLTPEDRQKAGRATLEKYGIEEVCARINRKPKATNGPTDA